MQNGHDCVCQHKLNPQNGKDYLSACDIEALENYGTLRSELKPS